MIHYRHKLYRSFAFSVFDHINTLLTFICSQLQSGVLTQTNQKCKTCGSKLFTGCNAHLRQKHGKCFDRTLQSSQVQRGRDFHSLISIFLLDALLNVVHAVWGSFANVAPGSGEKERRRVRTAGSGRHASPQRSRDHNSAVVRLSCWHWTAQAWQRLFNQEF